MHCQSHAANRANVDETLQNPNQTETETEMAEEEAGSDGTDDFFRGAFIVPAAAAPKASAPACATETPAPAAASTQRRPHDGRAANPSAAKREREKKRPSSRAHAAQGRAAQRSGGGRSCTDGLDQVNTLPAPAKSRRTSRLFSGLQLRV
jgi:hypothetical protein